jgi:hypothetical protein
MTTTPLTQFKKSPFGITGIGKPGGGMATFSPSGAQRLFLLRIRSAFFAAAAEKKVTNNNYKQIQ